MGAQVVFSPILLVKGMGQEWMHVTMQPGHNTWLQSWDVADVTLALMAVTPCLRLTARGRQNPYDKV